MKIKPLHIALGIGAFILFKKMKATSAAKAAQTAGVKDTQTVAGALGAVMTGNPMLQELGSLGIHGYKLRHW